MVEAWRKRRDPAAFIARLNDAEAEASETRVWLDFAAACGCLTPTDHRLLDEEYESTLGQPVRMIRQADQWAAYPTNASSPHRDSETKQESHRGPSEARAIPASRRSPPEGTP